MGTLTEGPRSPHTNNMHLVHQGKLDLYLQNLSGFSPGFFKTVGHTGRNLKKKVWVKHANLNQRLQNVFYLVFILVFSAIWSILYGFLLIFFLRENKTPPNYYYFLNIFLGSISAKICAYRHAIRAYRPDRLACLHFNKINNLYQGLRTIVLVLLYTNG